MSGRQWTVKAVLLNWGDLVKLHGWEGFSVFLRKFIVKKELKWFEVVVQYLIETWKPQVSGRLTLSGLSIA